MPLHHSLRALRSRNYRLFFFGNGLSLIGTWITQVATGWLVYRLTGSTALLGFVAFCGQMPSFILSPLAGVWVDRWEHRRTLITTQILSAIQSGILAALTISGLVTVDAIIWLSVFQGIINAFDLPARQAFITRLVEKRSELPNAIALNSSIFNVARLIGPAIAGVLIAGFGEGICFAIDSASYTAVVAAFMMMKIEAREKPQNPATIIKELRDGFSYAFGFAPIRSLIGMVALMSLFGMPYSIFLPVFAGSILGGGPQTLGILTAATGVGALAGSIMLAMRSSVLGLGDVIKYGAVTFGAAVMAFSSTTSIYTAVPLLAIGGFSMIALMAACNTLIQTVVDDDKRGRVMSLFSMSFQGMMPIGSVIAGHLAEPKHLGVSKTIALGGLACIVGGLHFHRRLPSLRETARPVMIKRGLIPSAAPEIGGGH